MRNRWNNIMPGGWGGYYRQGRQFWCGPWWDVPVTEPNQPSSQPEVKSSLTYIGPCRCGWGPHAYYRDQEGRIIHACQVGKVIFPQSLRTESQPERDKQ